MLLSGPRHDLRGSVDLPPSKSLTNRALVAAASADGGIVSSPLDCGDTRDLARALETAGWPVDWRSKIEVGRRVVPEERVEIDIGESGTGARLILGLLAASPGRCVVDGSRRLRERPMGPLVDALRALGARIHADDGRLPIRIDGVHLEGNQVSIRPEVSSQFVSSLLLAAPLMRRDLILAVEGPIPSAPYLDLTEDVLRHFGAVVDVSEDRRAWRVKASPLDFTTYEVETDWSAAAFFFAAVGVAGGTVRIDRLVRNSRQGDRAVAEILAQGGLELDSAGNGLRLSGPVNAPFRADLEDTPDLFPALSVVAAAAPPGSHLSGLDHLKHKESDRLSTMVENLRRLGAEITVERSGFTVERALPRCTDERPQVTSANDHRIAMAMAVAALVVGEIQLDDAGCVDKSFPGFWSMWQALLGGRERQRL
jgi:3-phosphoshikimate 1-carboxyvinyltransferase